mmetsp:Transcript_38180/g.89566  ORF Transcript_38180/g.89566 Transcript_38180/m.89566 type:complete len:283 (-) Transcript_38180:899-1747(-)
MAVKNRLKDSAGHLLVVGTHLLHLRGKDMRNLADELLILTAPIHHGRIMVYLCQVFPLLHKDARHYVEEDEIVEEYIEDDHSCLDPCCFFQELVDCFPQYPTSDCLKQCEHTLLHSSKVMINELHKLSRLVPVRLIKMVDERLDANNGNDNLTHQQHHGNKQHRPEGLLNKPQYKAELATPSQYTEGAQHLRRTEKPSCSEKLQVASPRSSLQGVQSKICITNQDDQGVKEVPSPLLVVEEVDAMNPEFHQNLHGIEGQERRIRNHHPCGNSGILIAHGVVC